MYSKGSKIIVFAVLCCVVGVGCKTLEYKGGHGGIPDKPKLVIEIDPGGKIEPNVYAKGKGARIEHAKLEPVILPVKIKDPVTKIQNVSLMYTSSASVNPHKVICVYITIDGKSKKYTIHIPHPHP